MGHWVTVWWSFSPLQGTHCEDGLDHQWPSLGTVRGGSDIRSGYTTPAPTTNISASTTVTAITVGIDRQECNRRLLIKSEWPPQEFISDPQLLHQFPMTSNRKRFYKCEFPKLPNWKIILNVNHEFVQFILFLVFTEFTPNLQGPPEPK